MNTHTSGHVDDGVLIRAMDGEHVSDAERHHLAACRTCRDRYRALGRRSDALAGLDADDPALYEPPADLWDRIGTEAGLHRPKRGRRWTRTSLAKAAAVATLLVAPLAAQPVREMVGHGLERLARAVGMAEAPASVEGNDFITIAPDGSRLVIRVDAPQSEGAVRLWFEDRADVAARLPGPTSTASLMALPDGFRVINPAGAGDYRFLVPAGTTVEVRVGGSVVAEASDTAGATRVVPLTPHRTGSQ